MGSLMSGWSCPIQDPKIVKHMRNRSTTREEIDAFWKTKKKTEEDQMIKSSSSFSSCSSSSFPTTPSSAYTLPDYNSNNNESGGSKVLRRWASVPMDKTYSKEQHAQDIVPNKTHCWWTWSKWAFLNEPPVLINEPTEKPGNYKPQHGGSLIPSTKPNMEIAM